MAFDEPNLTDQRGNAPFFDLQHEADGTDEGELEQSYLKRLDELASLASGQAVETKSSTEADADKAPQVKAADQADPSDGPKRPGRSSRPVSGDAEAGIRPRSRGTETSELIAAIREVSTSSATQALGLHALKNLLNRAQRNLCLALFAFGASYALQLLAAPRASAGLMLALVAWIGGVYWTVDYFVTTRKLTKEHRASFAAAEDRATGNDGPAEGQ